MKLDDFLDDARLKKKILSHLENGHYRITKHAAEQQANRKIDLPDILHVLKTGVHEINKTLLEHGSWKYAIRGKTEESNSVRVIICFSDDMIIITVINV